MAPNSSDEDWKPNAEMAIGVKSNNGTWIVKKATPYGKESNARSISSNDECQQKALFPKSLTPDERPV